MASEADEDGPAAETESVSPSLSVELPSETGETGQQSASSVSVEPAEPAEAGGGGGAASMARSLSKAEDTLQVQHTPDPSGPANGGKLSMSVGNYTTKSLSLYYYWNGKLSSRPVRIKSGERQSAKTYANARWRIVEAHHDSTAIEWVVDDAHGAVQQYDIREKSDADAEEDEEVDAEAEAERLARGQALIDELRGSTASADFVPSPSTDESLSSKMLSHGDAAAAAPSFSSLPNPSNYCFLNATTQCLRHTPHLAPNICAAAPYVTRAPFPSSHTLPFALARTLAQSVHLTLSGTARLPAIVTGRSDPTTRKPGAAPLLAGFAALLRRMDGGGGSGGQITAADPKRQAFIAACSSGLPPDIGGAALVQTTARHQAQQDAGEFLHHLLDQFSLEKDEQGELALRRESTHPRTPVGSAGLPVDSFEERLDDALEAAHKGQDEAVRKAPFLRYHV